MRSFKSKTIPIIIILILITILSSFVLFKRIIDKPFNTVEDIVINVQEGNSFYSILDSLSKEKQIKGVPLIKLYVKLSGKNIDVKTGEYVLQKDLSVNELINILTSESTLDLVKFTVPEGYTIDDISEKLEKEGICSKEDFLKAIEEYQLPSFVKMNSEKRYNLEGYLFPDTYLIKVGETPKDIIGKMIFRFKEVLKEALKEMNMTIKDEDIETVITIASMVEKEARVDYERPIISSVIINRLNINMKLQIDATVIYALGEHVDKVLDSHLEIDSPYNTYKNYGLPIGPISNPGLASIKASFKPDKTDYLFYVLKDDKTHYFTDNDNDFMNKLKELGY